MLIPSSSEHDGDDDGGCEDRGTPYDPLELLSHRSATAPETAHKSHQGQDDSE